MCEPKQNTPILQTNVSDENRKRGDAIPSNLLGDKSYCKESQSDSGYISGPINAFTEITLDPSDHIEQQEEKQFFNIFVNPSGDKLDCTEFPGDSGYISGQLSTDITVDPSDYNRRIELSQYYSGPITEEKQEMISDSGCISGLSVDISRLTINNLNRNTKVKFANLDWRKEFLQNDDGDTKLHLAINRRSSDYVVSLISISPHPCLLNIQNDMFQAPLHLAVITKQPKYVRRLLLAGADVTIRDRYGNSPLHLACSNGDINCVKELTTPLTNIERKQTQSNICLPDLEQRNYDGELCVHIATLRNHVDILDHLINSGADINAREGKAGRTPLHLAVEERQQDVLRYLTNEKCTKILHLESVTYAGLTAYQLAAMNNNTNILAILSQKGAEPLSPPEDSDYDSDFDENMMDQYTGSSTVFPAFNGSYPINVS